MARRKREKEEIKKKVKKVSDNLKQGKFTRDELLLYNLKDKDLVTVKCEGPRAVLFDNVLVRVRHDFALELHVDTDEGNGAMLKIGQIVEII